MRRKLFSLFLAVLLFVQSFAFAEDYYVGNLNTGKFHYGWCSSVDRMKEKNKVYITYNEAINGGYQACKKCNPSGNYTASYQVTSAPVVQKTAKTQPKTNKADVATKTLNFDGKTAKVNTIIQNGSSLMEVRSFVNAMGFILASENGAVSVTGYDGKVLYLYPNSAKVRRWNGVAGSSDELVSPVKTQVIGGRTYVPVRFLVENLGYSVAYDGNAYTVQGAKKSDYVQEVPNDRSAVNKKEDKGSDEKVEDYTIYYKDKVFTVPVMELDGGFVVSAKSFGKSLGFNVSSGYGEKDDYYYIDIYDTSRNVATTFFNDTNSYMITIGGESAFMQGGVKPIKFGDDMMVSLPSLIVGLQLEHNIIKGERVIALRNK